MAVTKVPPHQVENQEQVNQEVMPSPAKVNTVETRDNAEEIQVKPYKLDAQNVPLCSTKDDELTVK